MAHPGGNAGGQPPHQNPPPNLNPNHQIPTIEQLMYAQVQMMQQMAETMRLIQQNQHHPQAAAPPRDKRGEFLKGRPPTFSKASDPLEADDWLKAVERQLDIAQCDDREKVLYAGGQLQGPALDWWDSYQSSRPAGTQITWQQFCSSFRAHHVPEALMVLKKKEFLALKQEGMSVTAYRDKFVSLARYAPEDVATDQKKQARFRDGLQDALQYQLMCTKFPTFHELVDGALMLEHKRREMEDKKRKLQGQQVGSSSRPRFAPPQSQQVGGQQRFQGQSGMLSRGQYQQQRPQFPRVPQQQRPQGQPQMGPAQRSQVQPSPVQRISPVNTTPVGPRVCYHCGEQGHFANLCPKKTQNAAGQNQQG